MWFWWFMFICDMLIPVTMIIFGRVMWKHCPEKINGYFGYRTDMSMKNKDTWKYGNEYVGKIWWITGWILCVLSLLVHIPIYGETVGLIGMVGAVVCAVQIAVMLMTIIPTERALKKRFDKNGTQK